MKQFTYNQSNALSILLASFFFGKYPEAKVKTSDSAGTNFASKLEDEGIKPSSIMKVLMEEQGGDLQSDLSAGIVALHYDVENFDSQMKLQKVLNGDSIELKKIEEAGKAVNAYKASPAFKVDANDYFLSEEVDFVDDDAPATDLKLTPEAEQTASETGDVKE